MLNRRNKRKKSEKKVRDEKYHREYLFNILSERASGSAARRARIASSFDYYYGKYNNEKYKDLLDMYEKKEQDKVIPYTYMNWDTISSKINILLGEMTSRDFGVNVNAVNLDAAKRRKRREDQLRFLMQMQAINEKAFAQTGIDFGINENVPKNEAELKAHMESYRDIYEILMTEAMNEFIENNDYRYKRKNLFLDLLVGNTCWGLPYLSKGNVLAERLNPMSVLPDLNSSDDGYQDQTCIVIARYKSIPSVVEEYGIGKDVLKKAMDDYRGDQYKKEQYQWDGGGQSTAGMLQPFIEEKGNTYKRVLVVEAQWIDIKNIDQKKTFDKHGNLHVHNYWENTRNAKLSTKEASDKRNEINSRGIQIVRYCTVVGGCVTVDYGEKGDYVRDFANPSLTKVDPVGVVHNYNNMQSVSMVDRVKGLQDFKNYVMTLLQKELTTHTGSFLAIDIAGIDEEIYGAGEDMMDSVARSLKAHKIYLYDSAKGQTNPALGAGQAPTFVDPRVSSLLKEAIQVAAVIDQEIEKITGLNAARQGLGGERTLNSTNRANISQSTLSTETYFKTFELFEKKFMEKVALLIAMNWQRHPEKYQHIAARLGIDLPEDFKMDLQSYRVDIDVLPFGFDVFKAMIELSVTSGQTPIHEGLQLLLNGSKNLKLAIRNFIIKSNEKLEQQQELQQQQLAVSQKNAELKEKAQTDRELQKEDLRGKYHVAGKEIDNNQQLQSNKQRVDQKDRELLLSTTIDDGIN